MAFSHILSSACVGPARTTFPRTVFPDVLPYVAEQLGASNEIGGVTPHLMPIEHMHLPQPFDG